MRPRRLERRARWVILLPVRWSLGAPTRLVAGVLLLPVGMEGAAGPLRSGVLRRAWMRALRADLVPCRWWGGEIWCGWRRRSRWRARRRRQRLTAAVGILWIGRRCPPLGFRRWRLLGRLPCWAWWTGLDYPLLGLGAQGARSLARLGWRRRGILRRVVRASLARGLPTHLGCGLAHAQRWSRSRPHPYINGCGCPREP